MEKGAPDIQAITEQIVKEKVEEKRKKFDYERDQMLKDL